MMFYFGDPGGRREMTNDELIAWQTQKPMRPNDGRSPSTYVYTFPCKHRIELHLEEEGDYDWEGVIRCPICYPGGMNILRRSNKGKWLPFQTKLTIIEENESTIL